MLLISLVLVTSSRAATIIYSATNVADTTPGQEKVIAQAFDEMREAAQKAKSEVRASRGDEIGRASCRERV